MYIQTFASNFKGFQNPHCPSKDHLKSTVYYFTYLKFNFLYTERSIILSSFTIIVSVCALIRTCYIKIKLFSLVLGIIKHGTGLLCEKEVCYDRIYLEFRNQVCTLLAT